LVAKDLGISESFLRNWMRQADAEEASASGSEAQLTSAEKKETHPVAPGQEALGDGS
jgi:transposase-like protein